LKRGKLSTRKEKKKISPLFPLHASFIANLISALSGGAGAVYSAFLENEKQLKEV